MMTYNVHHVLSTHTLMLIGPVMVVMVSRKGIKVLKNKVVSQKLQFLRRMFLRRMFLRRMFLRRTFLFQKFCSVYLAILQCPCSPKAYVIYILV